MPELPKLAIFAVTLLILIRFSKLPEPTIVIAAALVRLVLYPLMRG